MSSARALPQPPRPSTGARPDMSIVLMKTILILQSAFEPDADPADIDAQCEELDREVGCTRIRIEQEREEAAAEAETGV